MGSVYKARHSRMDRLVALKVLSKQALSSKEAVARFQREVKASGKLSHPNIVTSFDAGEQDGIHYLVMEYVEGTNLDDLVADSGPLSVDVAVKYIVQAARGLEYAHRQGIVHRDIKPANLMLDQGEFVKILDMGLARIRQNEEGQAPVQTALTQTHTVMGTAAYMAPEQAAKLKDTDARGDIYSLGCTLHYLLTGKDVFLGESFIEMVIAHREEPIPRLRAANSAIPAALEAVFERMLAKTVESRYQTMSEVISELEGALSRRPPSQDQKASVSPTGDLQPFVDTVSDTGLLTREEIGEFLASIAPQDRPSTANELATALNRAERLSGYQAAVLTRGNPNDLIFGEYLIYDKLYTQKQTELLLAQHRQNRSWVVLKLFPAGMVRSEASAKAFSDDIGRASQISHDNLIQVYGSGIKDGQPYLVMEYVDGTDVGRLIKRHGPLPYETAVDYIWQASAALAHAHRQRMIHLNLKPSQCLVDADGRVKLTDLGLARFSRPPVSMNSADGTRESVTRSELLPSVDFVAPERVFHPRSVNYRADIYSIGALLYYFLTGNPVFRHGHPKETMLAHRDEPVPNIRDDAPQVPRGLQRVLAKALAKRPEDRYRSLEEFLSDLDSVSNTLEDPDPGANVDMTITMDSIGGPDELPQDSIAPEEKKEDAKNKRMKSHLGCTTSSPWQCSWRWCFPFVLSRKAGKFRSP